MSDRSRPDAYVRVPPEILERLSTEGSEPVVVLAAKPLADGTYDLLLRNAPTAELNAEESAVMDHILAAMQGIQDLGLKVNQAELVQAVHVLQGFVIQHMLQRIAPGKWGAWFGDIGITEAGEGDVR